MVIYIYIYIYIYIEREREREREPLLCNIIVFVLTPVIKTHSWGVGNLVWLNGNNRVQELRVVD